MLLQFIPALINERDYKQYLNLAVWYLQYSLWHKPIFKRTCSLVWQVKINQSDRART